MSPAMDLTDWLLSNRTSVSEFAAACGVVPSAVIAWKKGAVPRNKTLTIIETVTGGQVTRADFEGNYPNV